MKTKDINNFRIYAIVKSLFLLNPHGVPIHLWGRLEMIQLQIRKSFHFNVKNKILILI